MADKSKKPAAASTSAADDEKEQDEEARRKAEEEEKEKDEAKRRAEDDESGDDDEQDDAGAEEEEDENDEADETDEAKKAERVLAKAHPKLVAQIRRRAGKRARRAERGRMTAVIALAPKAITPALRTALESGQSEGAAAKTFLAAASQPGAAALAAIVGAEGALDAPTNGDGQGSGQKDGAPTLSLLKQYSPRQRATRAANAHKN